MVRELTSDDLYREEVTEARAMEPHRKLAAGLELFDRARLLMSVGIRSEHPDADDAEVHRLLVERLDLARRLESVS